MAGPGIDQDMVDEEPQVVEILEQDQDQDVMVEEFPEDIELPEETSQRE